MNLKVLFVSILVILLNLSSCSLASSKLPLSPEKISISWHKDGGMLWFSESISIKNDSCTYHINREGVEQNVTFHLTNEQLRNLYQIFIENQFDVIQTYTEEVHDRGGTSVSLKVDGESYNVSNSGMSMVKEKYLKRYNIVEMAIHKFTNEQLAKQQRIFNLKIDESISLSDYNVVIYINDSKVYSEKEDGDYKVIESSYFEMNNTFEVYLMTQDGNHSYDKSVENYKVLLPQLPENKTDLTLSIVDGELIIK